MMIHQKMIYLKVESGGDGDGGGGWEGLHAEKNETTYFKWTDFSSFENIFGLLTQLQTFFLFREEESVFKTQL